MEAPEPTENSIEITEARRTSLPKRPYFLSFMIDTKGGDQLASFNLDDESVSVPPVEAYSLTNLYRVTIISQTNSIALERLQEGSLTGKFLYACPLPSRAADSRGVAFSHDGSLVVVTHFGSESITAFSVTENRLQNAETYQLPSQSRSPWGVAFSPNGSFVAVTHYGSNHITIIPVRNKKLIITESKVYPLPSGASGPRALAFSPDGSKLAVANYGSDSVVLAMLKDGAVQRFSHRSLPDGSRGPVAILFSRLGDAFCTADFLSRDIATFRIKRSTRLSSSPSRAEEEPTWQAYFMAAIALYMQEMLKAQSTGHQK